MTFLFHAVADQFSPLGWSFYHFIWQGMLVAALYSACCLLCGADARRRHALACFFLGVALVLPMWQVWMILVRHHGLALGNGPPEGLLDWMTWAALIWICVAGAMSLRTLTEAVKLRRQWLGDAAEDMGLSEAARHVAEQIGLSQPPRVLYSQTADGLAVLGWWRPVVVIPCELPGRLTDAQLRATLAHELAHVARHDPVINLVQSVLESVVMFHPAAAWLAGEVRRTREHCCDDIAVDACGDAIAYARGLTALARRRGLENRAALFAGGGDLGARVVRLVVKRRFAWWIWSDGGRSLFWLGCAAVLVRVSEIVCRMM
jgi:Zn-dependent protease with chaperone function